MGQGYHPFVLLGGLRGLVGGGAVSWNVWVDDDRLMNFMGSCGEDPGGGEGGGGSSNGGITIACGGGGGGGGGGGKGHERA